MRKILTSLFIVVSLISVANAMDMDNQVQQVQQKSIRSIKDYNNFVSTMKKAIMFGNYSYCIPLGALYMQPIKFSNGKIKKANIVLAKKYFRMAFNHGYGFAAFYLSMLEDKNDAINDLKNALYLKYTKQKVKELIAIRYSELILNTSLYKNKNVIRMAIKNIAPIDFKTDNAILDFQLAHLYFLNKQMKIANKLLNSACNNPNADRKLLAMCINDPYIQTRNKNGAIISKADVIKDSTTPFNSICMQKSTYGK